MSDQTTNTGASNVPIRIDTDTLTGFKYCLGVVANALGVFSYAVKPFK